MTTENKDYAIVNADKTTIDKYYSFLDKQFHKASQTNSVVTKYLDLGIKIIRLRIANKEILPRVEQNFYYTLKNESKYYDATLYVWKDDINNFLSDCYKSLNYLCIYNEYKPMFKFFLDKKVLSARNITTNSFYFVAESFSDTEISKFGHLFVQYIYSVVLTTQSSLVHAASVGINDKGVLICAAGGSGKSTLAISCLMDGFQYVSDDYLIVNKENNILYSYPIYSMTNVTPQIYDRLPGLKSKFMYNNYNNTKYTLDISAYNENFVNKLAVKAIVFPVISNIDEPFIQKTNKTKAVAQFVFSTAKQMDQHLNRQYMKLLTSLVKDLDCYQINLSQDLNKNVKILKQFIKEL